MKKFNKFYIEITNVCNLACSFCPVTNRKGEFMQIYDFKKILEQIKNHTEYLFFHVKGEPLFHPDLDKFLDLSFEKGFKVNLTTNGTLIRSVMDKIINKPALRKISFSLHSFDGNEMKSDKEDYINDIIYFMKEASKTNIIIELRLWNLDKDNITKVERQRNNIILEAIEEYLELPYRIEEKISDGYGIKISDRIYLSQSHEFQWPDLKNHEVGSKGFCYGLRDQVAILVDGTVIPCCLDGEGVIKLGNIHEKEFSEIIEGERSKAISNGFSGRKAVEELCKKCSFRTRFDK